MNKVTITIIACTLITYCANRKLCKSELVIPNAVDSSFVKDAERYISETPSRFFMRNNDNHLFIKFNYFINDSAKNYIEMKFPLQDSVAIDSIYEVDKKTLWPFNIKGGGNSLNEKKYGSDINDKEKEWSKTLFTMFNIFSSKYELFQIDGGETIDYQTNCGRSYIYFRDKIDWDKVYCEYNPYKGMFNHQWIIEDDIQYRKFKINDPKDPWPIKKIDNKDSTVIYYKYKEKEVIVKPCNLVQAHLLLDEIFRKENVKIDSSFTGIEFHHGLGTWMRNNWGLWSGNSHLYDYYIEIGITHPDNMSGHILETYGITRKMKKDDLHNYYESIDVKKCNN